MECEESNNIMTRTLYVDVDDRYILNGVVITPDRQIGFHVLAFQLLSIRMAK
jgi:hypothetical protein